MRLLSFGFVLLWLVSPVIADTTEVGAWLEPAAWRADGSAVACALSRRVDRFGSIRFVRESGDVRRLELLPEPPRTDATVRVTPVAPSWHPAHPGEGTSTTAGHTGAGVLSIAEPDATRFYRAFEAGYLARVDAMAGSDVDVLGVASGVGFAAGDRAFRDCEGRLLGVAFADVERTVVTFAANGEALDAPARTRLHRVIDYLRADARIVRVVIDGHSDSAGQRKRNEELSQRRAEAVAAALREAGIEPSRLEVRYHADRYPIADNRKPDGRARNRRATLRLERGPPG